MIKLVQYLIKAKKLVDDDLEKARIKKKLWNVAASYNELHVYSASKKWMCPQCNKIHDALPEFSFFTGLQYPACCSIEEGHRHYDHHATKINDKLILSFNHVKRTNLFKNN